MTPDQQRIRTQLSRKQVEQQHWNCEMNIVNKSVHWGLYCRPHGTWIRWLNSAEKTALEIPVPGSDNVINKKHMFKGSE